MNNKDVFYSVEGSLGTSGKRAWTHSLLLGHCSVLAERVAETKITEICEQKRQNLNFHS